MSAFQHNGRTYYDNELEAHNAAREESKTSAFGVYVDEDSNGFFTTNLGRVGTKCYSFGEHEDYWSEE